MAAIVRSIINILGYSFLVFICVYTEMSNIQTYIGIFQKIFIYSSGTCSFDVKYYLHSACLEIVLKQTTSCLRRASMSAWLCYFSVVGHLNIKLHVISFLSFLLLFATFLKIEFLDQQVALRFHLNFRSGVKDVSFSFLDGSG